MTSATVMLLVPPTNKGDRVVNRVAGIPPPDPEVLLRRAPSYLFVRHFSDVDPGSTTFSLTPSFARPVKKGEERINKLFVEMKDLASNSGQSGAGWTRSRRPLPSSPPSRSPVLPTPTLHPVPDPGRPVPPKKGRPRSIRWKSTGPGPSVMDDLHTGLRRSKSTVTPPLPWE